MVDKGPLSIDPRGLIFESFRIEGITGPECRSIFFDWALSVPEGEDMHAQVATLIDTYRPDHPEHPMLAVLEEGLAAKAEGIRRGGRKARLGR